MAFELARMLADNECNNNSIKQPTNSKRDEPFPFCDIPVIRQEAARVELIGVFPVAKIAVDSGQVCDDDGTFGYTVAGEVCLLRV